MNKIDANDKTYLNGRFKSKSSTALCAKDDGSKGSTNSLAQENKFKNDKTVDLDSDEEPATGNDEEPEVEKTEEEQKKEERMRKFEESEQILKNETLKNELKHKELVDESMEVVYG